MMSKHKNHQSVLSAIVFCIIVATSSIANSDEIKDKLILTSERIQISIKKDGCDYKCVYTFSYRYSEVKFKDSKTDLLYSLSSLTCHPKTEFGTEFLGPDPLNNNQIISIFKPKKDNDTCSILDAKDLEAKCNDSIIGLHSLFYANKTEVTEFLYSNILFNNSQCNQVLSIVSNNKLKNDLNSFTVNQMLLKEALKRDKVNKRKTIKHSDISDTTYYDCKSDLIVTYKSDYLVYNGDKIIIYWPIIADRNKDFQYTIELINNDSKAITVLSNCDSKSSHNNVTVLNPEAKKVIIVQVE